MSTSGSSAGTATCQATYTSPGSHSITASYSGHVSYQASSTASPLDQTENQAAYKVKLLYDTTKAHNSGSTVPVKLQLLNAAGTNLSAPGITVTVTSRPMLTVCHWCPGLGWRRGRRSPGG